MKKQDRFPLQEYADRSVLTTWTISYEQVRRQSEEAAGLLRLWGFFDCADLWYELVASANSLDQSIEVPDWLTRLIKSRLEFLEALQILSHYSLVEANVQTPGHSIHSVLHEWCYHLAEDSERRMLFRLAASIVVSERVVRKYGLLDQRLLSHRSRVARVADDERLEQSRWPDDLAVPGSVFFRLGMLFEVGYRLKEAAKMYSRAASRYSWAFGPEDELTLNAITKFDNICVRQGKLNEAEKMYERAISKFETALGPTHRLTLNAIHDLGDIYWEQNKLDEAKEMYQRALTRYEMTLGSEHLLTSGVRRRLVRVSRKQNKPGGVINRFRNFNHYCHKLAGLKNEAIIYAHLEVIAD